MRLLGKTAIVTGASSGIGRATALALAAEGACIALAARRTADLEAVAVEVEALGPKALVVPTDVTRPADIDNLVHQTLQRWGRIDILISNAGRYIRVPVSELTVPDLESSMQINFYPHARLVLAVLPIMRSQHSGQIVFVATMDAKKPVPPDAPYVSAKFALSGFGDILRQELHGTGIDVTTVYPGRVDTAMIADLKVPAISAKLSAEKVSQAILHGILHRRAEVITPSQGYLLYYLNVFAPRLADWAVRVFQLQGRTTKGGQDA